MRSRLWRGASAEQPPLVPGVPGDANCHGQTMAYFAQASKVLYDKGGIGNLLKIEGEVAGVENGGDVSAIATALCEGGV